jgi:nucleotide-binding universal stress UspA family protein
MKNVLVPLDASEQAGNAFGWALDELDPDETRLVLLHVTHPGDPGHLPGVSVGLSPGDDGYAEAVADEYLGEFTEEADERGFEYEKVHVFGDPTREIVEYTQDNDVDRVVMGSHGRSGASRVLLGSVAENVVRRSPTPVTVVR